MLYWNLAGFRKDNSSSHVLLSVKESLRYQGSSKVRQLCVTIKLSIMYADSFTRKLCSRKDDRAMRHIHGGPEFSGLPDYAHGYYSQHFSWSFVPIDPMNVFTKFEFRSFTRS